MVLLLAIYGLEIQVTSDDPGLINCLEREIGFFARDTEGNPPDLCLNATLGPVPDQAIPEGITSSLITMYSTMYVHGDMVYNDFQGRGLLTYDTVARRAELYSEDSAFLATMAIAVIFKKTRELLPQRGIFAFPWLAMSAGGRALLFLMYPGGGKTSLLLETMDRPGLSLLGDTFTLVSNDGQILPFPRAIHKRGSRVPDIPERFQTMFRNLTHEARVSIDHRYFLDRYGSRSHPYVLLVCERVVAGEPRLLEMSKWRTALAVYRQARVKGKLQGALDWLVPAERKPRWRKWRTAACRVRVAVQVLLRSRTYLLQLGRDNSRNAQAVDRLAREVGLRSEGMERVLVGRGGRSR